LDCIADRFEGRRVKVRGAAGGVRNISEHQQEAKGEAMGKIEYRNRLLESYLRGLTDHRKNLDEYLGQLEQEREDLEQERRELNLRMEANKEKWEQVIRYIDEIPRLRDRTLRSLMREMEDLEDE
jgi:chromosome segregation ATPase